MKIKNLNKFKNKLNLNKYGGSQNFFDGNELENVKNLNFINILHCLLDDFLPFGRKLNDIDIESNGILDFFINFFNINNKEIKDLLINSKEKFNFINNYYKEKKYEVEIRSINSVRIQKIEDNYSLNWVEEIIYNGENYIIDRDKNKYREFLIKLAQIELNNEVEKIYFNDNNNYLIPSGWCNENNIGHLISVYIEKNFEDDKCKLTLFNCNLEDNQNLTKFKVLDKNESINFISYIIFFNKIKFNNLDFIESYEYYFKYFDNFENKEDNSGKLLKMDTFYGLYYNLIYILPDDQKELFKNDVKTYSKDLLNKFYNNKENITDFDRNIIDLVNIQIDNEKKYNNNNNPFINIDLQEINDRFKNYIEIDNFRNYNFDNLYNALENLSELCKSNNKFELIFAIKKLRELLDNNDIFFIVNDNFYDYIFNIKSIYRVLKNFNCFLLFQFLAIRIINSNFSKLLIINNIKYNESKNSNIIIDFPYKYIVYIEPFDIIYYQIYLNFYNLIYSELISLYQEDKNEFIINNSKINQIFNDFWNLNEYDKEFLLYLIFFASNYDLEIYDLIFDNRTKKIMGKTNKIKKK